MIYSRSWLSASKWKSIKWRSAGSRNFCPVAYRVLSPLHSTRSIALLINSTGRFFSSSEFFTSVVAAMLLRASVPRVARSFACARVHAGLARCCVSRDFLFFPLSFSLRALMHAHADTRNTATDTRTRATDTCTAKGMATHFCVRQRADTLCAFTYATCEDGL